MAAMVANRLEMSPVPVAIVRLFQKPAL